MVSTLQASILALVTSAASIAVGVGALSNTTDQLIVSAAGTIIGAVFVVANELKGATLAKAGRSSEVK